MKVFVTVRDGVTALIGADLVGKHGDGVTWCVQAEQLQISTSDTLAITTSNGWTWYLPEGTWLSCVHETKQEDD